MRGTRWRAVSLVSVLSLALLSCTGPNRGSHTQPSAASGYHVAIDVSPNAIRGATAGSAEAQGGCATVIVTVTDTNNHLVDGAFVFVDTTLGRFPAVTAPPPGRPEVVGFSGLTTRGVLLDTLCAKSERGTATLTATVEGATATAFVTIF